MTAFLTIFRRFPTTFPRFPKIFQNCPKGQANVLEHFSKIAEDFRRLPKTFEEDPKMFRSYTNEFNYSLRDKFDTSKIIDVSTSEYIENTSLESRMKFRMNFTSGISSSKILVSMQLSPLIKFSASCYTRFTPLAFSCSHCS